MNLLSIYLEKYENKRCNFCKEKIKLGDSNPYYFQILGLGKYDKKYICGGCIIKKSKYVERVNGKVLDSNI
jgi:hypothetical protein